MEYRKVRQTLLGICATVVLAVGLMVMGSPIHAAQTTVGGNALRPTNGSVQVLPTQPAAGHWVPFSVKLSTRVPTAILAANATRLGVFIVNASTKDIGIGVDARGPVVYITTGSTTNLGTAPAIPDLPNMKAIPLYPCGGSGVGATVSGRSTSCNNLDLRGNTVPSGAIWGIAESSSTTGYDPLGTVQGYELYP